HRKTVVAGLEELKAQGWIETKPGVGTFVRNPEKKVSQEKNISIAPPAVAEFVFKRNFILDEPENTDVNPYYFTDGTADYRVVPPKELVRFYTSVLKRKQTGFKV